MISVPDYEDLSDEEISGPRALIVGDIHFKTKNVLRAREFVNACIAAAEQYKPDFIVLLGDILDTHEIVRTQPYKIATEFIEELSKIAEVFVLIGNHDYINQLQFLTENHPFNPLKKWDNVTIVDKVVDRVIGDKQFTFVPFVPPGRFVEALDTCVDWKSSECIFAHQEFKGCKMGAMISICGDEWKDSYPKVISGHIHNEQKIGGNIWYTGSAIQHSFGEESNKFIWSVEWGDKQSIEKVDLGLKRKKMIYTSMEDVEKYMTKSFKNEEIKMNIKGRMEEFKVFRKSKNYAELIRKGVKIVFNPIKEDVVKVKNESHRDYRSVLYDLVLKDESLKTTFEEMFGNLPEYESDKESSTAVDGSVIETVMDCVEENMNTMNIDSDEVVSFEVSDTNSMKESETEEEIGCINGCEGAISGYCIKCDDCVCEVCELKTDKKCPNCSSVYQSFSELVAEQDELLTDEVVTEDESSEVLNSDSDGSEVNSDSDGSEVLNSDNDEDIEIQCAYCENPADAICEPCEILICDDCAIEVDVVCQECGNSFLSIEEDYGTDSD